MSRVRARADLIMPSLAQSGQEAAFEELIEDVARGRCLFFEGSDAVLIVQLIHDQDGFSVNIWIVGGNLATALQMLVGVEALARGAGAGFCSFSGGRKGWERLMPKYGYHWNGHEFRKAL